MNWKRNRFSIVPYESSLSKLKRLPRVALIDDDMEFGKALTKILKSQYDCVVKNYLSLEESLNSLDNSSQNDLSLQDYDLILLDFHLPGQNGPRLISELKKRKSEILEKSCIMGLTGDSEPVVYNEFNNVGIMEVLAKPLKMLDYRRIAERAYRVCAEGEQRTPSSIPPKYV